MKRAPGRGFLGRYFGDFACSRVKLAAFRVVFFALVGIDGLRQLPHAPRYGAGDFNVGHFAWLDALLPMPSRSIILVMFLAQAYLGFFIAFGRATRAATIVLTAVYGYAYFSSQLDSYQHHYLVFLLLLLSCFVPWHERAGQGSDAVTSWAVRLIIVQVAIVYLWASMAKLEEPWLDGTVLGAQLDPGRFRDMVEWLGTSTAATLVTLTELFLFVALLWRKLWPHAVIAGMGLHAGIEFGAGFHIGIFSYYMFGFYLLLLPDRWYERGHARLSRTLETRLAWLGAGRRWLVERPVALWSVLVLALAAGGALVLGLPLPEVRILAVGACLFALATFVWHWFSSSSEERRVLFVPVAHVLASVAIIAWPGTMEYVGDYYKYWGGSARRLNQWDEAEVAYRELVELRPGWGPGQYHLGRIEERSGDMDAALDRYRRAQEANPEDHRPFLNEAAIHHNAGRGPEAVAAAREALAILRARGHNRNTARDIERANAIVAAWPGVGPAP